MISMWKMDREVKHDTQFNPIATQTTQITIVTLHANYKYNEVWSSAY